MYKICLCAQCGKIPISVTYMSPYIQALVYPPSPLVKHTNSFLLQPNRISDLNKVNLIKSQCKLDWLSLFVFHAQRNNLLLLSVKLSPVRVGCMKPHWHAAFSSAPETNVRHCDDRSEIKIKVAGRTVLTARAWCCNILVSSPRFHQSVAGCLPVSS